jgi:hypothetical protein
MNGNKLTFLPKFPTFRYPELLMGRRNVLSAFLMAGKLQTQPLKTHKGVGRISDFTNGKINKQSHLLAKSKASEQSEAFFIHYILPNVV